MEIDYKELAEKLGFILKNATEHPEDSPFYEDEIPDIRAVYCLMRREAEKADGK